MGHGELTPLLVQGHVAGSIDNDGHRPRDRAPLHQQIHLLRHSAPHLADELIRQVEARARTIFQVHHEGKAYEVRVYTAGGRRWGC